MTHMCKLFCCLSAGRNGAELSKPRNANICSRVKPWSHRSALGAVNAGLVGWLLPLTLLPFINRLAVINSSRSFIEIRSVLNEQNAIAS